MAHPLIISLWALKLIECWYGDQTPLGVSDLAPFVNENRPTWGFQWHNFCRLMVDKPRGHQGWAGTCRRPFTVFQSTVRSTLSKTCPLKKIVFIVWLQISHNDVFLIDHEIDQSYIHGICKHRSYFNPPPKTKQNKTKQNKTKKQKVFFLKKHRTIIKEGHVDLR